MATSNVTVWTQTRDELITSALRKLTVIPEGAVASATQLSDAIPSLNGLLSSLQTMGLPLWKRETRTVSFVSGQRDYTLGIGQAINTAYPLKVLQATVEYSSGSSIDMELLSDYNFKLLPSDSTGLPVKGRYHPKNDVGVFSVWPIPDASAASTASLELTYQKPFDIFTSGTETLDFPREWYNPIVYGLADLLSDDYGLPLEDRRQIGQKAMKWLAAALEGSTEEGSIFFYPDRRE